MRRCNNSRLRWPKPPVCFLVLKAPVATILRYGFNLLYCRLSAEGYCDTFELNSQIPASVVSGVVEADQLSIIEIPSITSSESTFESCLKSVTQFVAGVNSNARRQAVRLSIPDLGDPNWGDTSPRVRIAMLLLEKVQLKPSCLIPPSRIWLGYSRLSLPSAYSNPFSKHCRFSNIASTHLR
jgi:hypothetical protein